MSDKIYLKEITLPIVETGENETYSFVQTDADLDTAGDAADAKAVGDELTNLKQDLQEFPNGNYPNMTAGNADQLVSTVFIEDEVPYNFRTSGGSADIGDREYDEIVGVSMPINQLYNVTDGRSNKGVTVSAVNGAVTITGTSDANGSGPPFSWTSFVIGEGHKVLVKKDFTLPTGDYIFDQYNVNSSTDIIDRIVNIGNNDFLIPQLMIANSGVTYNISGHLMVFDLTLMLGTQIADYVYGIDQSTAGSGVTWLKHHFPKIFDSGYIPYNAGEMQSVSGLSAHRMTGFNQWDEEWESGAYSADTGAKTTDPSRIRSKNYVPVLGGTSYYFKSPSTVGLRFYDANKNFLGSDYNVANNNMVFVTPANARYLNFSVMDTTTYNHDISINLHWDGERDGQYEEYKEYEYALDDSVVLRGILKLDSSNSLYADGDRYLPDGTVERRWRETNMADLTWNYDHSSYRWQTTTLSTVIKNYPSRSANLVSDKWVADTTAANGDNGKMFTGSGYVFCYSTDSVNKPTGTLLFELATPTTETAEPYQTPQIVDDWGTEEYVSTSLVPVGHDTKYANNLRAKLEMSPDSPEEDGDYIVRHNNGENEYVALGSTTTIQGILDRLTALENA